MSTQCNRPKGSFAKINRRCVEADFEGGLMTSNAGAPLLREADRTLALSARLAGAVEDPRDPRRIRHSMQEMINQRMHAIALGYEDLNDHKTMREDPALLISAGGAPDGGEFLASAPTLCRLENSVRREDLVRMSALLVDLFIESHCEPPEELILDFDATDDPLHGKQEGRFFHGYYGCYCYLPLYVFCGRHPLVAYLRKSGIDAARHARAILKMLVERLREAWPQVRIVLRGDSGFCRPALMHWCERHGVHYILGLGRNSRLERLGAALTAAVVQEHERTGEKVRWFEDFQYAAGTWEAPRRVIAKAEHTVLGPNHRFVVTDLEGDPRELYDELYCARGEMENRIKAQQLDLFSDRTSCRMMAANQFRVLVSAFACILVEKVRESLAGTELERAEVGTIRERLLRIAARVYSSARRILLRMTKSHPWKDVYLLSARRLAALPSPAT